ncbi:e3 ubiquitin-protein ligase sina-like 10 [Nicotiana attenuata]|uniref:RING-type E3 ubiquitin transferase n=2 Tax=Nicotiana attenuata TaxID=49451 RepID=A0A1J6IIM3_NICAT|nr:e3 ubiquitin-protein ligase sina-like 10 [Nicotiana attenuata]
MAKSSLRRDENANEEGSSWSTRPVPKKRRTSAATLSCKERQLSRENEEGGEDGNEQENVIEEEAVEPEPEIEVRQVRKGDEEKTPDKFISAAVPDPNHDKLEGASGTADHDLDQGSRGNKSTSMTLSDPDVLDCPICVEILSVPVFQCENGHIACAPCCFKIANKCPLCCCPIGYIRCRVIEKVLDSVKVSCVYEIYGCKEIRSYGNKTAHENACIYAPCACPYDGCDFVDTSTKLYAHFHDKHGSSAEHIFFNTVHPIYIEKNQSYQILQEKTEGIVFIINHSTQDHPGSAVNIICVGPALQTRRFRYELVATDGESTFKLGSIAENVPKWSENFPLKKYLLLPRDFVDSTLSFEEREVAQLKLEVFVEREYIF